MFKQILEQVTGRFGLDQDKAKQLLGMLVAQIFNPKRGGPDGFLQSFREQGLGDTVDSWLGHGPNQPISAAQLEGVLGTETLDHMSARLGVPAATVSGAAAAILPDAVNELSEHGDLPASAAGIPGKFGSWLGNLQDHLDDFGHWGAATAGASAAALGASVGVVGDATGHATDAPASYTGRAGPGGSHDLPKDRPGPGRWLQLLLLAAAVIVAILVFRSCQRSDTATPTTPVATETPAAATPAAEFDSRLVLTRTGDKVTYDGVVDSEATKAAIIAALTRAHGAGNVSGNITVDANARTPGWLSALGGFLPQFTTSGATLTFEGHRIDLSGGGLAEADTMGLRDRLNAAFAGFSLGGAFEGLGAAAADAADTTADAAGAALDKLTPGNFNAGELVEALNLMIIHFDTGSATISANSDDILGKAAGAIKAAPSGTRIEVGGHTDNTGNAEANRRLSQQRADAVKARLVQRGVGADMLSTQGYGQDKPVADNGDADGRARNRRIEFTVQK